MLFFFKIPFYFVFDFYLFIFIRTSSNHDQQELQLIYAGKIYIYFSRPCFSLITIDSFVLSIVCIAVSLFLLAVVWLGVVGCCLHFFTHPRSQSIRSDPIQFNFIQFVHCKKQRNYFVFFFLFVSLWTNPHRPLHFEAWRRCVKCTKMCTTDARNQKETQRMRTEDGQAAEIYTCFYLPSFDNLYAFNWDKILCQIGSVAR